MITHIIEKKMVCTESPSKCSDILRVKLEKEFNFKLMAEKITDIINGAISIDHTKNAHIIKLEFYTENITRTNKPLIKKLSKIPSKEEFKKII